MSRDRNAFHDDSIEARARRRVGMKIGLAIHALVYVLVNGGLYVLNSVVGGAHWSHFPLLGWGLGLAIHAIVVATSLTTHGLRTSMVEREMARIRARG